MNFKCNRISISDEELGCTISFYEKEKEDNKENRSVNEIIDSIGTYLMLQRTYPEDEFEKDFCYIEMNDIEKSGELKEFEMILKRTRFQINWNGNKAEIEFKIEEEKYKELKDALRLISKAGGILIAEE